MSAVPQYVANMTKGFEQVQIPTNLTGYEMHRVVNKLRSEAGLTSQIPPQMMYNYLKKGYVTPESFPTWVVAYIERAVKRSA